RDSSSLVRSLLLVRETVLHDSLQLLFFAVIMANNDLAGLSLHDEEEGGFSFDFEEETEEQTDLRGCLVGRFISERPIHVNSMKARMADQWKPLKGVTIKQTIGF
ncbi:hypothetical protein A2U01_0033105, partial [Trifolium medium]|nr:hypothetical protein [Trifolium medium]